MIINSIKMREAGMTIRESEKLLQRISQNGIKRHHTTSNSPFSGYIIQRVNFDTTDALKHYRDRLNGDEGLARRYGKYWRDTIEKLLWLENKLKEK